MPKLVMFDLDGTLTVSKSPLTDQMAGLLAELMAKTKVAVVSGGALPQYLSQVVARLPAGANLENLSILPTSGSALYEYRGGESADAASWEQIYEERIPEADAREIEKAAQEGAEATGLIDFAAHSWGPRIEYRGSQVSLSAFGQHIVDELGQEGVRMKEAWDPDKAKRQKIREAIQKRLPPGYSAKMGGMTTIDINKDGVDKAYGIEKLCARLGIPEGEAVYVGDQLVPGGNDEAAFRTGIKTRAVATLEETEAYIRALLAGA